MRALRNQAFDDNGITGTMRGSMSRIIDVFRGIDKDRSNYVSKDEFRKGVLATVGSKYRPETLDAIHKGTGEERVAGG